MRVSRSFLAAPRTASVLLPATVSAASLSGWRQAAEGVSAAGALLLDVGDAGGVTGGSGAGDGEALRSSPGAVLPGRPSACRRTPERSQATLGSELAPAVPPAGEGGRVRAALAEPEP